jgi:hypothetical protein
MEPDYILAIHAHPKTAPAVHVKRAVGAVFPAPGPPELDAKKAFGEGDDPVEVSNGFEVVRCRHAPVLRREYPSSGIIGEKPQGLEPSQGQRIVLTDQAETTWTIRTLLSRSCD